MRKRIISMFLSIVLCFSAVFVMSGCITNPFVVTFDKGAEDAVLVEGEIEQRVTDSNQIVEPTFSRPGYTFVYWEPALSTIKGNTKVTAVWEPNTYQIVFDGGSPSAKLVEGEKTQEFKKGDALNYPVFERTGYTLSWAHVDEDAINQSQTIVANWIANEYILSFVNSDGSTLGLENKTVTYNEQVGELPTLEITNDKKHGGWLYNDGSKDVKIVNDTDWIYPNNATLKAVWLELDEYLIEYVDAGQNPNVTSYKETSEDIVLINPTKVGHTFIGWSGTGIDGISENVTIPKGSTGDREFTANWEKKVTNVTFDAAGGTMKAYKGQLTYGNEVGELEEATLSGYKFDGWYLNDVKMTENTVWNIEDGQVTFIAKYKRIYTIKLKTDCTVGGNNVVTTLSNDYISNFNLTKVDGENAYVYKQYIEGEELPVLPKATPSSNEYEFSNWSYAGVKKEAGLAINEANFPGSKESGVITLEVVVKVYTVTYKIKFVLETTVRGELVTCSLPKTYIDEKGLIKSDIEENVYYFDGFNIGDALPELPKAIPSDTEEYEFSCWKYNGTKQVSETIINETNFPEIVSDGTITLKVACYALWTPFY